MTWQWMGTWPLAGWSIATSHKDELSYPEADAERL